MSLIKAVPTEVDVAVRVNTTASRKRHAKAKTRWKDFVRRPMLTGIKRNGNPGVKTIIVGYNDFAPMYDEFIFIQSGWEIIHNLRRTPGLSKIGGLDNLDLRLWEILHEGGPHSPAIDRINHNLRIVLPALPLDRPGSNCARGRPGISPIVGTLEDHVQNATSAGLPTRYIVVFVHSIDMTEAVGGERSFPVIA